MGISELTAANIYGKIMVGYIKENGITMKWKDVPGPRLAPLWLVTVIRPFCLHFGGRMT